MYSRISTGNLKAYHISRRILSLAWGSGEGGACPPQASYAIMLQVYDDYYMYHIGSFSHHALSPCSSAWTIPTFFGNIDLSTCRLVDLSTCRPSASVNNKYPVRVRVRLGLVLAILAILICRLVELSTCRPSAIVNNKDPVRVRIRLGLVLGLVCG